MSRLLRFQRIFKIVWTLFMMWVTGEISESENTSDEMFYARQIDLSLGRPLNRSSKRPLDSAVVASEPTDRSGPQRHRHSDKQRANLNSSGRRSSDSDTKVLADNDPHDDKS